MLRVGGKVEGKAFESQKFRFAERTPDTSECLGCSNARLNRVRMHKCIRAQPSASRVSSTSPRVMAPTLARLARLLSLCLVATLVVSATAQEGRRPSQDFTSRTVSDGVQTTRARDPSFGLSDTGTLRQAPRVVVRGELRLCGGDPMPAVLFSPGTLCVEQKLTGVTAGQVREKSLDVTGVNVTFAGNEVEQSFISDASLVVPGKGDGRGFFDWGTQPNSAEETPNDTNDDDDVFCRFTLDVDGLLLSVNDASTQTSGTLESVVKIQPAGRYYYEIVWFELSLTVPTFYQGAVNTIVEKGDRFDTLPDEMEEQIDDLVSGSAVFCPCTNVRGNVFCDENGISA